MTQAQRCPACAATVGEHCFEVDGYGIRRCAACGSLYVEKMPAPEVMAAFYESEHYYELSPEALQRNARESHRRMRSIRRIKPSGSLLDIGCAQGLLLSEAARMGYRVCGVEPTKTNARIAIAEGHEVFDGTLEVFVAANPSRRFDVVVCLDVIEHITDPRAFLDLALSLMAEDGLLVLSTPNYSGLVARLLGPRDPYMTPPGHVVFYTATGLRRLAESAGLRVERHTSFGHLVDAEIRRAVQRYLPRLLHGLAPVLKPLVNLGFASLNRLGLGLEQEAYLTRQSPRLGAKTNT